MRVIFPSQNPPHRDHRRVMPLGKCGNTHTLFLLQCGEFTPQIDHLLIGEGGMAMPLTAYTVSWWFAIATFVHRIVHVISMTTSE